MDISNKLEIAKKFIETSKKNICFIVADSLVSQCIAEDMKDSYQVVDLAEEFTPFKPFLNLLSKGNLPEKIVREKTYSIQTESFVSFFKTGMADERYDIPIDNEELYELGQYVKSIVELFKELPVKNYIFTNAQNIFSDSFAVIKELENHELASKFVFCFNSDVTNPSVEVLDFLEKNTESENFLYLQVQTARANAALAFEMEESENSLNVSQEFKETMMNNFDFVFSLLRNNRLFMSFKQLKILIAWVSKNFSNMNYSVYQKRTLLHELAIDCYVCKLEDESILHFNDIIETLPDDDFALSAAYYLARIFYLKKSGEFAKKYALQVWQQLNGNEENPYYALLSMLEFQFVKRSDANIAKGKYIEALKQLEAHGFVNNYIATGLTIPWNLINTPDSRPLIEDTIDNCMRMAKKYGNNHLYSTACHWKGIIASHYGERDVAMKWYNDCNKIRTEIGEIGPLMNIRNGLSYESLCRALYKDAYDLVNGVISNIYNLNDYSRIVDCLKNISYALFYARHYDIAHEIFSLLLHFLRLFNMEEQAYNSFLPSRSDILILKTIIDLDRKDVIHATINFNQIESTVNSVTMEEKPLIPFIRAILLANDSMFEESEKAVELCVQEFKKIKSNQTHKNCFVYFEYAVLLKRLNQMELSQKYLDLGYNLAKENNFAYYTKNKDSVSVEDYLNGYEKYDELNINLAFLLEKAEKENLLTQLHKRIHDYQFLNKVKTNNLRSSNLKKYIKNTVLYIYEYCFAESVFIGELTDEGAGTLYSISRGKSVNISSQKWKKLFKESTNKEVTQFVYKEKQQLFFGNMTQFEYKFGIVIIPTEQNPFTNESINTLNIALSTIQSQIVIYKQDENLLFLSTTDTLSLLNNRHALQKHLLVEGDRIRRYAKRKSTKIQVSIAFMDLDNFKYYNDTFGHNAGDLFITCFAKLLKNTCRQVDFISRFGGDEFVVVMTDTNETESCRVYERLKEALAKEEYFIPQLRNLLGVNTLEIPSNRYLGFSMGICTNYDIEDASDLNAVLKNADKALYHSKETCKGTCTIWSDIKDKVQK